MERKMSLNSISLLGKDINWQKLFQNKFITGIRKWKKFNNVTVCCGTVTKLA
jgi:hypothetical protein